ncbi:MAG: succinate dehydrogenase, hydrophobic membrane anchor protein [Pseudomonadota bacterium]
MSMRSELGRARGLGSAKEGVSHWWAQRVTAVALIPLSLWFVAEVVGLAGADQRAVAAWIGAPVPALLLVLLLAATFHHAQLGLTVVIEDYVHREGLKIAGLLLVKGAAAVLGAAGIFAVLRLALGG